MPSKRPSSSEGGSSAQDLHDAKNAMFAKLAPLDFVSGAGVQGGEVAIYLTRALKPEEEKQVADAISSVGKKAPVKFVVAGTFEKR
jgi:hypothetical protein